MLQRRRELLQQQHLLISKHTRLYLTDEHYFPGPAIDRANRSRWQEEGGLTLRERSRREVDRIVADYQPSQLSDDVKAELTQLMQDEGRRHGMDSLPHSSL